MLVVMSEEIPIKADGKTRSLILGEESESGEAGLGVYVFSVANGAFRRFLKFILSSACLILLPLLPIVLLLNKR